MTILHGHNRRGLVSPTYSSWTAMKTRCLNPKAEKYASYGAQGITVCSEWLLFENFLRDMGPKPGSDYSIERVNNAEGYCKDNCKWATTAEQNLNQGVRKDNRLGHKNIRITLHGFQVRFQRAGKAYCIGTYPTLAEAITQRDIYAAEAKNV